jgi:hypothetical protein
LPPTKSEKDGPALSLSVNLVGRTRGLWVGDSVAEGSVSVVAKERDGPDVIAIGGKKILNGDGDDKPYRQHDLESLLAMTPDFLVAKEIEMVGRNNDLKRRRQTWPMGKLRQARTESIIVQHRKCSSPPYKHIVSASNITHPNLHSRHSFSIRLKPFKH